MTLALPRTIQLRLEQTLAQSSQWLCNPPLQRIPTIVKVLTPGVSNYSVLVESGQRFVVRIDGINPSANGLNRQTEWRALETASRAGLAPCPRYFNPELGSLVCDYLAPDNHAHLDPAGVGHLLRKIHQLPARHHRLDLAERILRYERLLQQRGQTVGNALQQCGSAVHELVYEFSRHAGDGVLCHNDLLRANRIHSAGKLWALDWEYCAMGSPWYDLAVVINGDLLSIADQEVLLSNYLGRSPSNQEWSTLHYFACIYRYLELLWYLALDTPVLDADAIAKKTEALQSLLAGATA